MRNAKYDEQNKRWDTPLRKLIRKMPDIALIVLNNCCKIKTKSKNEQILSDNENKNEKERKEKKEI